MVIILLALAVIGQAAAYEYTVTVKTATIENQAGDLNLTVTMEGKGGNRITHVLRKQAREAVELATRSSERECTWGSAMWSTGLGGTKLSQRTTKSYSNPSWMNGNTFAENVALCMEDCESNSDCAGLQFSPTSWDHQECFLMSGSNTYTRSSWKTQLATCTEVVVESAEEANAWRADLRCGANYLNAAGDAAECNPDDPDGYTCCSPYGWCGRTVAHCECDTCINYAEEATEPVVGEEFTEDNSRECEWSTAVSNIALSGTKLKQITTKSYSNPGWMNGNTFAENVALCEEECTINPECEGLNFSPTSWDHQECFLVDGSDTYSRSGWSYSKATCTEQEDDDIENGGIDLGISVELPVEVDTAGEDGFASGSVDVFHISDDIYLGTLLYVNISSNSDNAWQLDWMLVETEGLPNIARYVYNTETHHLSTDSSDDDGKAVDLLQMEVQGTETYYLVVETANKTEAGSDAIHVKAIIHGTSDVYTGYLDNPGRDDFTVGENDVFIFPGMGKAGRLECLTLLCWGDDSWEFDWIVVFSIKSYTQPPRVFWNNDTVMTTNSEEGVNEYHVCRNDNQWGSEVELLELE